MRLIGTVLIGLLGYLHQAPNSEGAPQVDRIRLLVLRNTPSDYTGIDPSWRLRLRRVSLHSQMLTNLPLSIRRYRQLLEHSLSVGLDDNHVKRVAIPSNPGSEPLLGLLLLTRVSSGVSLVAVIAMRFALFRLQALSFPLAQFFRMTLPSYLISALQVLHAGHGGLVSQVCTSKQPHLSRPATNAPQAR